MNQTDLTLEMIDKGHLLPPLAARECTQTLSPISQGTLRRTINGELVCVSTYGHRKFQSIISCQDKAPPAFEGLWIGMLLKVGCIQSLTQPVPPSIEKVQLARDALSLHLYEQSGKMWTAPQPKNRWVSLPAQFPGGFLTYRPVLMMRIKNYSLETDEWGLTVGWTLELEEE